MQQSDLQFDATITVDVSVPYRAYLPSDYSAKTDNHPLLLFLHGAGERGSDLDLLSKLGLPKYIEDGAELPFVTICPQCPTGESWNPVALVALLDQVISKYRIDTSRVYLSGLSMGGRGTWELANMISDRLAAVIPVCPPFFRINPANFAKLPVWCFHGVMDSVIPVADSVRMVRLLRDAGCEVEFTTYANVDHDSWTLAYNNPEIYRWLLNFTKPQ